MYFSIMLSSVCEFNFEVKTRTATKFLSLLLSCVALGSNTQGTHKEQNLLFVHHAREWKLESDVQKNRSIKPKTRLKAKKWPDVWQGQHQVLEVQQALISLTQEIISTASQYVFGRCFAESWMVLELWEFLRSVPFYSVRSTQGTRIASENKSLMKQEIVPQGAYLLLFCSARLFLLPFRSCWLPPPVFQYLGGCRHV